MAVATLRLIETTPPTGDDFIMAVASARRESIKMKARSSVRFSIYVHELAEIAQAYAETTPKSHNRLTYVGKLSCSISKLASATERYVRACMSRREFLNEWGHSPDSDAIKQRSKRCETIYVNKTTRYHTERSEVVSEILRATRIFVDQLNTASPSDSYRHEAFKNRVLGETNALVMNLMSDFLDADKQSMDSCHEAEKSLVQRVNPDLLFHSYRPIA